MIRELKDLLASRHLQYLKTRDEQERNVKGNSETKVSRPTTHIYRESTPNALNEVRLALISGTPLPSIYDNEELSCSIHELFLNYDAAFFESRLGCVVVEWSNRMTRCAGICQMKGQEVCIRLSASLLKFRCIRNLHETLLHEMIHAYLYLTKRRGQAGHNGHGVEFVKHMRRINGLTGLNITVYHNFIDEVKHYQTHVWRCDGPCRNWSPHFGKVQRAMNRKPGPSDWWFEDHRKRCGGTFMKETTTGKALPYERSSSSSLQ